uniref:Large ribosomal subunit protein uL4c n=1 Tax=Vertebrata lanosa TaxID=1261582 RepID=A0A0B5W2P0_9FLOR|nr:50S ribosomal protein L4 [Vertebrata lanosa]AJH65929.1 50S ribosomal protein L4 [Vertebrata lanosa]
MSIIKELKYQIADKNKEVKSIQLRINDHPEKQMYLIHKALKQQLTNNRIRNAHAKTRAEVRGGGKKPWKQKGTGRARAGSNRSPLWRGGGVIFGPRKKVYQSKINKKEKRTAINTLISNKFKQTIVIKDLLNTFTEPSTKKALQEIKKLGINLEKKAKLLIIVEKKNSIVYLSFRNVRNIELIEINSINILSLLKADTILITHKAAKQLSQNT